uniref:Predicted gene 21976 n=1 Tax=Mus spicilegus TaxID=10103 RepID=A0A8C6IDT9_MUSSI
MRLNSGFRVTSEKEVANCRSAGIKGVPRTGSSVHQSPGLPGFMAAPRVHPQGQATGVSFLPTAADVPSDQHRKKGHSCLPTRKCLLTSCGVFLVLGVVAAAIAVGIIFGTPTKPASWTYHQCRTASQQPGFLCEDRTTCLPPSLLCDGKTDCRDGWDEAAASCGQMPDSLPQNLIFKCPNQKTWTFVDRVCDTRNDCGDCSDESVSRCPECSGWRCETVFFADCACIPRSRCRNGIQDCADWSDENLCD